MNTSKYLHRTTCIRALESYFDALHAGIGANFEIKEIQEFDKPLRVGINGKVQTIFSLLVCKNLLVR